MHRADEVSPLAIARAAVLASGISDAVASHRTAARVHGIEIPPGAFPEQVTVQRHHRRVRRRELVFHARTMDIGDVIVIGGVPVTSPARTLVDLAGSLNSLPAVWAIDDALRRGLTDRRAIARSCESRPGAPGEARARDHIRQADGKAESILETAGRLALVDAGLRLPVAQYRVDDGAGFVAFLDGAYPDDKVGLEFDGHEPHSRPEAIFRDRRRQNSLMRLGWTILRFTWWDVMYGTEHYVAQVRGAVSSAAA